MAWRCMNSLPYEGEVSSHSQVGRTYRLTYDPLADEGTCACPANEYAVERKPDGRHWCKHLRRRQRLSCTWTGDAPPETGECPRCGAVVLFDELVLTEAEKQIAEAEREARIDWSRFD